MPRSLPWIIVGGVALIAGIVIAPLLGTYFYLKSPDRAVAGAFSKLLEAKSFNIELAASQADEAGFSINAEGDLDKRFLTRPVADLSFSFQAPHQSFYGKGELRATDGKIYLRFGQIAGIEGLLPGALQAIWADIDAQPLVAVLKDSLFPQSPGTLTEDDLQAIKGMVKRNMPIAVIGKGEASWVGMEQALHYRIRLDKAKLVDLAMEIQSAVKGSSLGPDERRGLSHTLASYPEVTGEAWVRKSDGRLVALTAVAGKGETAMHINAKFSQYDRQVSASAPLEAQPLIALFRRALGSTLGEVKLKLPFDIPAPILAIEQKIPQVNLPPGDKGGEGNLGGLPDLIKLFYGTDKPFAEDAR